MTNRLTTEEIEAIRKRAENATEGPWEQLNGVDIFTPLNITTNHDVASDHNDGWHIATCVGFTTTVDGEEIELDYTEVEANAEFIAAARSDIPKLLAEVERLRNALTEITFAGKSTLKDEIANKALGGD